MDALRLETSSPGMRRSHSCRWALERRTLLSPDANMLPAQVGRWQPRIDIPGSLDAVVADCNRFFDLFLEAFLTDYAVHQDEGKEASLHVERLSEEHYENLCQSFAELLPWIEAASAPAVGLGVSYAVFEFQGCGLCSLSGNDAEPAELLSTARKNSTKGRARDAFCALAAVLASRREKSWLEAFDIDFDLARRQKEVPKESKQDRIKAVLAEAFSREVRGYFAHGLVSSRSTFRVAVATPAMPGLLGRPASLLLTYRLPLRQALEVMDDGGPLPEGAGSLSSPAGPTILELGLQDLDVHSRGGRQPVQLVCPEPTLSALLHPQVAACTRTKNVVLLDVVAALAPRSKAKEHGLSDIVKVELSDLLGRAKSRGEVVIFMLGGSEPHVLAEKVYLREPFIGLGLRCGYLRWREAGAKTWAKEKPQGQRVCIGLQLP